MPEPAHVDILFFFLGGLAFPLLMIYLSLLLRRDHPERRKQMPYESGIRPFGDARVQVHVAYYVIALMFVVFDVETVFLYPWGVAFHAVGPAFALVEGLVFIAMLVIGLVYAWRKKVLTWE